MSKTSQILNRFPNQYRYPNNLVLSKDRLTIERQNKTVSHDDDEYDDFDEVNEHVDYGHASHIVNTSSQPRKLTLFCSINREVSEEVIQNLISMSMDNPIQPIEIWINSPGGCLQSALAIYDIFNYVPCPIHTVGIGDCSSAAALLLAAGEPGARSIFPNTRLTLHAPRFGSQGTTNDIEIALSEAREYQSIYSSLLIKHTNITEKYLKSIISGNKDFNFRADKIIDLGIADYIKQPIQSLTTNKPLGFTIGDE